jgi:hypothetical protein
MGDFAQRRVIVTALGKGGYKLRQACHITNGYCPLGGG